MWGVNRWLSVRFNLLSSAVVGVTGVVVLLTPAIDASLAGFALAFASTVTNNVRTVNFRIASSVDHISQLLFMVRRFVGLEQSLVAVERVKEFSELPREAPEFIEPRPPASWPSSGIFSPFPFECFAPSHIKQANVSSKIYASDMRYVQRAYCTVRYYDLFYSARIA